MPLIDALLTTAIELLSEPVLLPALLLLLAGLALCLIPHPHRRSLQPLLIAPPVHGPVFAIKAGRGPRPPLGYID